MKSFLTYGVLSVGISVALLFVPGCDIFPVDGNSSTSVTGTGGYFYLLERSRASLIMMDSQLRELKRWDMVGVFGDSSLQGITFDGEYLWVSSAGGADVICMIDVGGDTPSIIRSFDAPPLGRGTIRDLAWDGTTLWALNSGSSTYGTPATLYRLNPANGAILAEFITPTPEPRALAYVNRWTDVYQRGPLAGLYYGDNEKDMIYLFTTDRPSFDSAFSIPTPPRGNTYRYPAGLTTSGTSFWMVNSSNVADHLYRLSYTGKEDARFDLPYDEPGPIVWTDKDLRRSVSPTVTVVSPNSGAVGTTLTVSVFGTGFKPGAGLSIDFGPDIAVVNETFVSPTELQAGLMISSQATAGPRTVVVTLPGGVTASADSLFTVTVTPQIPHLWLAEQDADSLYVVRISDTTIVMTYDTRSLVSAGSPQGLAFDGTHIWLSESGTSRTVFELDTTGGVLSIVNSFPSPTGSGTLRGVVWDNGSIWLAVSNPSQIYNLNPADGSVIKSISAPGDEPRGLALRDGQLYCNDTQLDSVYAYDPGSSAWSAVFAVPTPDGGTTSNRFTTGLTWDGTSFWIANSTGNFDHIYRLSTAGAVLQVFAGPRQGPAQLTGLVYTPN